MKKLLNKKGFTIVELVIVIAVIGILAAVLIPTFSNVIESANKTADLQEAQSTLKAYTAYMGSKGSTLNDGTVFKVERNNSSRTYVFYKGELHEFFENATALTDTPAVTIGGTTYACNKLFQGFDENDNGKFDTDVATSEVLKNGDKFVTFFYYADKNVTFEDGSLKCKIYAGTVIETVKEINSSTVIDSIKDDAGWKNVTTAKIADNPAA